MTTNHRVSNNVLLLTFLALGLNNIAAPAAYAEKSATTASVKIGYFNANLVKASFPEAAGAEALRLQAEGQLRQDLEDANKTIQKMQEAKKSPEEIQKAAKENQISFDAKRQAIVQLLQSQNLIAREKLTQALNQVAKDRGLDLVVDADGIYLGGKTCLDDGVDITQEVVRKLSPLGGLASEPKK